MQDQTPWAPIPELIQTVVVLAFSSENAVTIRPGETAGIYEFVIKPGISRYVVTTQIRFRGRWYVVQSTYRKGRLQCFVVKDSNGEQEHRFEFDATAFSSTAHRRQPDNAEEYCAQEFSVLNLC